jgi:hypothetical protein
MEVAVLKERSEISGQDPANGDERKQGQSFLTGRCGLVSAGLLLISDR